MKSPNPSLKDGKPDVHGCVAVRTTQPVGYETERPCRADVKVSVNAGGEVGDGFGAVEAAGDGETAGEGLGCGEGAVDAALVQPASSTRMMTALARLATE
jgi:hypothetical protein